MGFAGSSLLQVTAYENHKRKGLCSGYVMCVIGGYLKQETDGEESAKEKDADSAAHPLFQRSLDPHIRGA